MYGSMAQPGQTQPQKSRNAPQLATRTEALNRQARVEELRQLMARGQYRVSPQRLALKILVKALRKRPQAAGVYFIEPERARPQTLGRTPER